MTINVYFTDKVVSFRTGLGPRDHFDAVLVADTAIPRAKVLKIIETCNRLAIISHNPQKIFNAFAAEFKNVNAGGGLVRDAEGRILMIHRRGRWDLPKGHKESNESTKKCAMREVGEETGIKDLKLAALLCNTYHAYDVYGVWELKNTHWFLMTSTGSGETVPQTEEDIVEAVWVSREQADLMLENSYPTIREVFDALDGRTEANL